MRNLRVASQPGGPPLARLYFLKEVRANVSWEPVYRMVKQIPRGRVTTYGDLARALRLPGGARAVGYAMAACPGGRGIPWHRVVGAGGRLLVPEPHAGLQRRLLETEGVPIEGGAADLRRCAWSPAKKRPARRKRKSAKTR
jgi:methylated-DNA-protein-cysteine methyltransferase-like protein